MAEHDEFAYRRTVHELRELASKAPYVTEDWILTVASMDPEEMRRRLIRSHDWHCHFAHSLDGIPEIRNMPGSGIDGCRTHKEVRAVVTGLLTQIERLKAELTEKQDLGQLPDPHLKGWFAALGDLHHQVKKSNAPVLERNFNLEKIAEIRDFLQRVHDTHQREQFPTPETPRG